MKGSGEEARCVEPCTTGQGFPALNHNTGVSKGAAGRVQNVFLVRQCLEGVKKKTQKSADLGVNWGDFYL